jgi:hypothetical protein
MEGPDLSHEVVPGQHEAMELFYEYGAFAIWEGVDENGKLIPELAFDSDGSSPYTPAVEITYAQPRNVGSELS